MPRMFRRRSLGGAAAVLTVVVMAAGCDDADPSADDPTAPTQSPQGSLTAPGSELSVGDAVTVPSAGSTTTFRYDSATHLTSVTSQ